MASGEPVEAPDGTAAKPVAPEASVTSAATVGLRWELGISKPWTWVIALVPVFLQFGYVAQ